MIKDSESRLGDTPEVLFEYFGMVTEAGLDSQISGIRLEKYCVSGPCGMT